MVALPSEPPVTTPITGLTEAEAQTRRAAGQGNDAQITTSRSYVDIFRANIVNPINIILFTIGAVMIVIGRVGDAVTSVGLIVLNVVIGIYQEIRAKRQLDQIALLTRPRVTVLRDAEEKVIDPSEIVLGDILVAKAGDQIVVDGKIVGDGKIDADESLLTGESDLIAKVAGDEVLSGSFVVTGQAYYEAIRVGHESFANKLTANAREFQMAQTPLQREINFILRLLMLLAAFIGFMILLATTLAQLPFMRQVQMAAVIAGLVPNGLFFMVILAYAMGALRIVQRGALVQQSNAVESLSNVTVLCTDKTGTLTANKINFNDVYPVGAVDEAEVKRVLGIMAHSASSSNKTSDAISEALQGEKIPFSDEVPFSSALKWSALAFDHETIKGAYVMGALEMLNPHLKGIPDDALEKVREWSEAGLRVLVIAYDPNVTTLHDADDKPTLPKLTLMGIVSFSDELRPQLKETLKGFYDNDITVKVISGDNPQTVAALARQAGFPGSLEYVSGPQIDQMDDVAFLEMVERTTVFGRITPDQKERIVDALQKQGHYVAMIGDGVNDVLSLKKANMGIAMESGSSATRSVADMILLNDSFGALPPAFREGQRIVNGMKDILRLFLTRVLYTALLILATAVIGLGFPYVPKQNALMVLISVGLPTLALAIWARPGKMPRGGMIKEILHFVIPAALSVFFFGILVYLASFVLGVTYIEQLDITSERIAGFQEFAGIDYDISTADDFTLEVAILSAQTALMIFSTFAGLVLVIFVEPPHAWFVGGDEFSGDWRPTMLAGAMFLVFMGIIIIAPLRDFFEMIALPLYAYPLLMLTTVIWALVLRRAWRKRWLQRFLAVDF